MTALRNYWNPKMRRRKAGLRTGYVLLGSSAHIILKALMIADMGQSDLTEETGLERRLVGMTLTRLREFHYIWPYRMASKYELGAPSQMIYSLTHKEYQGKPWRPSTAAERSKKRRDREREQLAYRARRISSIFNLGAP